MKKKHQCHYTRLLKKVVAPFNRSGSKRAEPPNSQSIPPKSSSCLPMKSFFDSLYREGGYSRHTFCIFNRCYFISSTNKLKICYTIKQLYIHNIMPKHENNALQKNFYDQFKKGTFSVCISIGYT